MKYKNKVNKVQKEIRYMNELLRKAEAKQKRTVEVEIYAILVESLRARENKLRRDCI
ncbi:MAG: hypothetical protein KGI06_01935 [Candidatus Micrarchaeota archaeon]|nr:hypothetical protein [Candidatus Micrarchaeota archaeon]